MRPKNIPYVCPQTGDSFTLENISLEDDQVVNGYLVTESGHRYPVCNRVPDFVIKSALDHDSQIQQEIYDKLADNYDLIQNILMETYKADERTVYTETVDKLSIDHDACVLEVGCGCGFSSKYIAEKLSAAGSLFLQDLSPASLEKAVENIDGKYDVPVEFSVADACSLPFTENFFDAAIHIGGVNTFSDIEKFCNEMARVVKPGGRVVFADEGMAPWLRNTQFGKIMMNSNPLLHNQPPLEALPVTATETRLEWVLMGAYYVIDFTVAESEPVANYHVPIPSLRGGTHWTRYHGQLEGVSDEAKEAALKACMKSGKSMHEWLDELVLSSALQELDENT